METGLFALVLALPHSLKALAGAADGCPSRKAGERLRWPECGVRRPRAGGEAMKGG